MKILFEVALAIVLGRIIRKFTKKPEQPKRRITDNPLPPLIMNPPSPYKRPTTVTEMQDMAESQPHELFRDFQRSIAASESSQRPVYKPRTALIVFWNLVLLVVLACAGLYYGEYYVMPSLKRWSDNRQGPPMTKEYQEKLDKLVANTDSLGKQIPEFAAIMTNVRSLATPTPEQLKTITQIATAEAAKVVTSINPDQEKRMVGAIAAQVKIPEVKIDHDKLVEATLTQALKSFSTDTANAFANAVWMNPVKTPAGELTPSQFMNNSVWVNPIKTSEGEQSVSQFLSRSNWQTPIEITDGKPMSAGPFIAHSFFGALAEGLEQNGYMLEIFMIGDKLEIRVRPK